MANNKCDILLIISLASFVTITLPISSIVISDYKDTRDYTQGTCNGSTISNYTVSGGFFFHGRVDITAEVDGSMINGYLYYPPIKHWGLAAMPREGIDDWYESLNKTGAFQCFVDLTDPSHPMVDAWIPIIGYYIMFIMSIFIVIGSITTACFAHQTRKRHYMIIQDELPPPYTAKPQQQRRTQSLYKSLNDELTTISV